jgi:hypothetical protein
VAEGDPAQALHRHDPRHSLAVQGEHAAQPGVEQQRLTAHDEERVEGESGRRGDVRHKGREPIDAVSDFGDFRSHSTLQGNVAYRSRRHREAGGD